MEVDEENVLDDEFRHGGGSFQNVFSLNFALDDDISKPRDA